MIIKSQSSDHHSEWKSPRPTAGPVPTGLFQKFVVRISFGEITGYVGSCEQQGSDSEAKNEGNTFHFDINLLRSKLAAWFAPPRLSGPSQHYPRNLRRCRRAR